MAIRSISRLQHRRGLKSDLPPKLHEGEIGWCLDTRELYIGNSDAYGENTQVLTQWTPNDQLIQHSYVGATGIPADSVPRSIGQIVDDVVSVRDYGAKGNGIDDDYEAIQNAITDRYLKAVANGFSPRSGFVTIWFQAGDYRITQPLKLYPYVRLQGEGYARSRIVLDNELADCVVETADSNGNTDINIGLDSATLPVDIDIIDLWLDQLNSTGDVVRLARSTNVTLDSVRISGPRQNLSNVQIETAGIRVESLGNVISSGNFVVVGCEIYGMGHAFYTDDPVTDIRIDRSKIHHNWHGVTLGESANLGGPYRTHVTNTVFANIESTGIACHGSNPGVISMGNSFTDVGVFYSTSPIHWGFGTQGCASIGDQFDSSSFKDIINDNPTKNIVVGPAQVSIAVNKPELIGPVTLLDNKPVIPQDTTITYDSREYNTVHIDYSLTRSTDKRSGRLTILTDGTRAVVQDEFTGLGNDLGVTFGYKLLANVVTLTYTTTTTGSDATMSYTETKWLA